MDGLGITLAICATALAVALVWGLAVTGLRMAPVRVVRLAAAAYIELMRNTPLLLQLYVIYFGLPLIGWDLSPFACGAVAIALQHGAFLGEIYRAGIESIASGQWEASRALGLGLPSMLRAVVLPQAIARVLPPVGNQLVILVKDSSLVSAIGIMDLTLTGKWIIERSGASYEVFVIVGAIYLGLTSVLSAALRLGEWRLRARQA